MLVAEVNVSSGRGAQALLLSRAACPPPLEQCVGLCSYAPLVAYDPYTRASTHAPHGCAPAHAPVTWARKSRGARCVALLCPPELRTDVVRVPRTCSCGGGVGWAAAAAAVGAQHRALRGG